MLRVLEVTLPVFALVFCGYFGQRSHLLPARAVQGINAFVFFFALPAMLFRVVATQPPSSFNDWRFAIGYAVATVGVFLFTRSAAMPPRKGWRDDDPGARAAAGSQATAFGLNTAHGNIGYLGIPLVLELGRDYLPTLILAMICDIFLVITLAIALLELDRRRGGPRCAVNAACLSQKPWRWACCGARSWSRSPSACCGRCGRSRCRVSSTISPASWAARPGPARCLPSAPRSAIDGSWSIARSPS